MTNIRSIAIVLLAAATGGCSPDVVVDFGLDKVVQDPLLLSSGPISKLDNCQYDEQTVFLNSAGDEGVLGLYQFTGTLMVEAQAFDNPVVAFPSSVSVRDAFSFVEGTSWSVNLQLYQTDGACGAHAVSAIDPTVMRAVVSGRRGSTQYCVSSGSVFSLEVDSVECVGSGDIQDWEARLGEVLGRAVSVF